MKKGLLKLLFVFVILFTFVSFSYGQHQYIGVDKCKICHKTEKSGNQYGKWMESKHSKSFQALSSDKAKEIGNKAGISNPSENEKCLSCHSPYAGAAPNLKADGVGCEACHGAGNDYKAMNVMKNRDLSIQNGLIVYANEDAIKMHCLTCHKKDNSYHEVKEFDFKTSWTSIAHPVPSK
ncbi:MAG: multiheme c-type cytochrome [Acidobacteriota bacterium]